MCRVRPAEVEREILAHVLGYRLNRCPLKRFVPWEEDQFSLKPNWELNRNYTGRGRNRKGRAVGAHQRGYG